MLRLLSSTNTFRTSIILILLIINVTLSLAIPAPVTASQSSAVVSNSIQSGSGVGNAANQKEGLTKRNAKAQDLASSGSATAKSYDPQPEFYRGSSPTSKTQTASASENTAAAFVSKPVSFPENAAHTKYNGNDLEQKATSIHNNWKQLHGGPNAQDRISIKPFLGGGGGDSHGLTAGYSHGGGTHAHLIDYGGHGGGGGGYYAGAHSGEVPFDLYGGKGSGQYAGAGGEYSYTYPEGVAHDPALHKDYANISKKTLLAKSFLLPLAGAAVLGIAAALVTQPWLLQLGAFSGAPLGATVLGKRRRRRDAAVENDMNGAGLVPQKAIPATTAAITADGADLAYRAYRHLGVGLV